MALEESQREFADARNTEERLRILGEGEAFLRDAIAVARAYSGQIPDPNELKRWPGTGKRVNALIRFLNDLSIHCHVHAPRQLDVSAGEDRSRVRHRTSVLNLAMIRRATIRVAVHWIKNCKHPRKATTSGFF